MTDAVTAGTFSDFKLVKTRKVAQFVIEFPLERADEALEMLGGLPRPDREVWVAIARLKADPFTATGSSNGRTSDFDSDNAGSTPAPVTSHAPAAEPERRKITDLPFSQRAAMLAQDKLFHEFLKDRHPNFVIPIDETDFAATPADAADRALKALCRIDSKRDLNTDHDAAERFDRLSRAFWQWKQEPVSPAA